MPWHVQTHTHIHTHTDRQRYTDTDAQEAGQANLWICIRCSWIRFGIIAISIYSLHSWLSLQTHPPFISPSICFSFPFLYYLFIYLFCFWILREDLQWLNITREHFYGLYWTLLHCILKVSGVRNGWTRHAYKHPHNTHMLNQNPIFWSLKVSYVCLFWAWVCRL